MTQSFSTSTCRRADDDSKTNLLGYLKPKTTTTAYAPRPAYPSTQTPGKPQAKPSSMSELLKAIPAAQVASGRAVNDSRLVDASVLGRGDGLDALEEGASQTDEKGGEPYHFHIYSHKHNTHVTVTKPNRDAIVSLSCGNLGFRKSQRKHYDSAYQLGAYVIDKLQQQGWHNKMHAIEVVLRGFGAGREAITKVILGNEGRLLRGSITKVSDSTRLKFGGTRSKKPRRLG